jgi:hypothetical protein
MSQRPTRLHRSGPRVSRLRLGVHLSPAAAGGVPLPDDAPNLTIRPPESARAAVVSGTITTLLHVAGIAILAWLAWMAPEVAQLIPVKIVQELPGSNDPAPAPRKVIARRPVASVSAAQLQQTVRPTTTPAQRVSAQSLNMAAVDPVAAPAQIQRRQVDVSRVTAVSVTDAQRAAVDLSQVSAVSVQTGDLTAPVVDVAGPRQVAAGAVVAAGAPQITAAFEEVGETDYTGQASPGEYTEGPVNEIVIDTGVSDEFAGGTGGTGTAENTVSCMESAFVQRYLDVIRRRTEARWDVPSGTPIDARVVLRFELDSSGTAANVDYDRGANSELGASAVAALRAASPFPPMTDNNRCLSELSLKGTFSVPAL